MPLPSIGEGEGGRGRITNHPFQKLITTEESGILTEKLRTLHFKLNIYIKKLKQRAVSDNK